MEAAHAAATLRWWVEAGVDVLVDDHPRDWLAADAPVAVGLPRPTQRLQPAVAPVADSLPDTLDALFAWFGDPATLPALGRRRLAPVGTPASGLMLLVDMPDTDDREGLLTGSAGRLLDRMLAAIGRDRVSTYIAPLAPARPPGGRLPADLATPLVEAARRHVALAAPRLLLLMGQAAVQAFGLEWPAARGRLHSLNHDGGTVAAIATFHPRFLLAHPACKADAWADLRLALGEIEA